ncbi:nucleotide disphospho-sugar-binding domain-containing protein [Streptomyces sp. NPDC059850]|uniref:nucleotide disphospho-sugar-binding domain-containing protein n=1 Tax=Streptomyces sp. NPDC059850 TaxID=3346970 RepID=UPI003650EF21
MRVLVMTTPDPSHLPTLVPVAWALRAAGHEVLVLGRPDSAEPTRTAGLNFVSLGDSFNTEELVLNDLAPGKRPLESRPRGMKGGFGGLWMEHAKSMVRDYLDFARSFRPELIISDPLEYSALILGALLQVPVVHHRWGVDPIGTPRLPAAREELRQTCQSLGLDTLPDPTVVLDSCPSALQLPELKPETPVRYVPFNGSEAMPSWLRAEWGRPRSRPKRVAVSLGRRTLVYNGVPFVRALLHSFAEMRGVELIATVGARHRESIGPVPANVRMVDPVPLHLLLSSCDAVITHGGAATTMTAALFGLPQLVLPQMADCFAHGDRLAATGAGISFDTVTAQDDAGLLHEALTQLLTDSRYAEAAGVLRTEMECMPSPAQIASDLEKLARAYGS